jgi:5,10-methylenetetrahydromethanopterin reductase
VRVTLRVSPFAPVQEVAAFTQRVEEAGFDGAGYLDSQMINRDVFVTMGLAASMTSRLRLITAVTNPVTRHVSTLASAAATVSDLAPGRVEIWLGRGFSSINLAGLPEASTRQLRQAVVDLKRLFAGEWDVFPGTHSRLRNSGHDIPVYVAAAGPRTMRMAGEVADGLLLASGFSPEAWDRARGLVEEGARATGRDPADVDICISLLTCIRETREEALRWAGPLLVMRLDDEAWLARAGIDARGVRTPAALSSLYPDPMHAEDQEQALDIAESVPLELRAQIADKAGIIGTPEDCVERLRKVATADYDSVFLRTVDTLSFPAPEVELYRERIRPAVAALG